LVGASAFAQCQPYPTTHSHIDKGETPTMSFFVEGKPVPVYLEDDPQNIIYIKPKMGYGSKKRVESALVYVSDVESHYDLGKYNMVLLRENIISWEGPLFVDEQRRPLKYKPDLLENVEPDHPLLDKVLEEINTRNKRKEEPVGEGDEGDVIEGEASEVVDGEGEEGESPRPNPTSAASSGGGKSSKALTRVK
jgi:hypothetical protein